jgi:hypothetical protein
MAMGMRAWAAFLVLGLASAGCVGRVIESRPTPGVPSGVPEAYRAAYGEIAAELDRQLPFVTLPWGGKRTATAFGVELLAANSSRGPELLQAHVMAEVGLTLDRLAGLGVRCVALSLQYPVLTRGYPRSADYREFYRRVAAEIRSRDLKIVAEMGSASAEPELGRLGGVRGVRRDALNSGLREMAEAIVADIRPDFLTVLTEPDTLARNTGLTFTPSEFARTVAHVVRGLPHDGVRLGAGAGTWTSHDYFKELARLPELDYLDLHIYPVQHGFASDRALKAAETARAGGKGVSIGEAWLYKTSSREWRTVSAVEAFGRDAFAFWQPLDQDFIRLVVELARRIDAEFSVFSWTKYLYAYLPLTPETERMPPGERMQASDRAAAENIVAGRLSATGERFKSLIAP